MKLTQELTSRGQYLSGSPLHPSSSATSVRVRDGKRLVTDGPFAETREQLGGYMLIDVKDLDEAIAIAARVPLARTSTVEVRPVREGPPTQGRSGGLGTIRRDDLNRRNGRSYSD
jgi:hypothetical protein